MVIDYIRPTPRGHQYILRLFPNSCDLPPEYIQSLLNSNEEAQVILKEFSFSVSRIQGPLYMIDLTLGESVLKDSTLTIDFAGLTGELIVFKKFAGSPLAEKIGRLFETSLGTVTSVVVVSGLVLKASVKIWGFCWFPAIYYISKIRKNTISTSS